MNFPARPDMHQVDELVIPPRRWRAGLGLRSVVFFAGFLIGVGIGVLSDGVWP